LLPNKNLVLLGRESELILAVKKIGIGKDILGNRGCLRLPRSNRGGGSNRSGDGSSWSSWNLRG